MVSTGNAVSPQHFPPSSLPSSDYLMELPEHDFRKTMPLLFPNQQCESIKGNFIPPLGYEIHKMLITPNFSCN